MPSTLAKRITRASAATIGAVVLAAGLTACGSSGSSGSASGSSNLTIGFGGIAAYSFNPFDGAAVSDLLDPVYDTLIHYGADGKLEPWLATSWTFKDPTTLELKLRDDVTFSDGVKFDAEAVKANLQVVVDGKATTGNDLALANVSGTTVIDPTTIDITLKTPNPALPYDLSQYPGYMVSPKGLQNPDALKQTPAGSGPYVLDATATRTGVSYVFKRAEKYWAAGENRYPFDSVTYSIQSDPTALKNAASAGQIQLLTVAPGTDIPGFETVTSQSGNQSGFTGAWLDTTGTALKAVGDVRVRQAMNYAIDRAKVAQAVYQGTAIPVPAVPVTKGNPAYSDELAAMYPYDPAKAKQLLAEAGYADGFELTLISLPPADKFSQALAGQLSQVGITVKVESHGSDLVQAVQSGTRPAGLALGVLSGDPGQDLSVAFSSNAFFNTHHGSAPELDALLKQAAEQTDEGARDKLYQQAAIVAADAAWYVGSMNLQTVTAFDPKIVKVTPPDRGIIHLYDFHRPS